MLLTIHCIYGAFDHCLLSSQKVAALLVEAERDLKLRLDKLQKRKIAYCDDNCGGVDHYDVHDDCCVVIFYGDAESLSVMSVSMTRQI